MNKNNLLLAVICLLLPYFGYGKSREVSEFRNGNETSIHHSICDKASPQKSLNDIRFGDWTEKDWYDNEYIRCLRKYLDNYLRGKEEIDEDIETYKKSFSSKFVILDENPYLLGGLLFHFCFIDYPDVIFVSNVYSDVDIESEKVTGYMVKSLRVDDTESGLKKDELLKLIKEHPEHKLW